MDIFVEINRLPQYLYVFNERELILGGQSCPNEGRTDRECLVAQWKLIKGFYEKHDLSETEKADYAQAVKRMSVWCRCGTIKPLELRRIIDSLSDDEKRDIVWQIEMYKQGRSYLKYI